MPQRVNEVPPPCKPDSVLTTIVAMYDHLSYPTEWGTSLAEWCDYYPGILNERATLPLFCLAPRGVCSASLVTLGAVGSYPTFSPLPRTRESQRRFVFCCTFRPAGLNRPSLVIHKARCPMASGLSSMTRESHCDRPGSGKANLYPMLRNPNPKYKNLLSRFFSHLDFTILNLELSACPTSLKPTPSSH